MRALPWIIGGGVAAYALTRSRGTKAPHGSSPIAPTASPIQPASSPTAPAFAGPLPGRWVWPVPSWQSRAPSISDGFGSPRPGGIRHGGVDVMFARLPSDTLRAGTPNGSAHHVMPDGTRALAAADGVVWSAMQTPRGFAVPPDQLLDLAIQRLRAALPAGVDVPAPTPLKFQIIPPSQLATLAGRAR